MLQKVDTLILRVVRYGDSSLILKTYSQQQGLLSFIASVSKKSKTGLKPSLLQPLNQLETVYYGKSKGDLKRLKEARLSYQYQTLPYEPVKSCLAIFLAEVLQHVLHEEEAQPILYNFITDALQQLDASPKSTANFHLVFLLALSRYLGFGPETPSATANYFDLLEGRYTSDTPKHSHFINGPELELWKQLQNLNLTNYEQLKMAPQQRSYLLKALLSFFRLHVNDFGELRSLAVLQQVLH